MKITQILLVFAFLAIGISAEVANAGTKATCDVSTCPPEMCGTAQGNCSMPCCAKK